MKKMRSRYNFMEVLYLLELDRETVHQELKTEIDNHSLREYLHKIASEINRHEAEDSFILTMAEICRTTAIISGHMYTTVASSNVGTVRDFEYVQSIFKQNGMSIEIETDDYYNTFYKVSWK